MINATLNKRIHETADVLAAMTKCLYKEVDTHSANLCAIWYKNGSSMSVATDGQVGAMFSMKNIEDAMEESNHSDFDVFELVAFHANLKAIQYKNGIAFTTSKFYDGFLAAIGKPISESGEWLDFEYPDMTKALPNVHEWGAYKFCTSPIEPKKLCMLNKIKNAFDTENVFPDVELILQENLFDEAEKIEEDYKTLAFAVYPGLLLEVMSEYQCNSNDINKHSDLEFFKNAYQE